MTPTALAIFFTTQNSTSSRESFFSHAFRSNDRMIRPRPHRARPRRIRPPLALRSRTAVLENDSSPAVRLFFWCLGGMGKWVRCGLVAKCLWGRFVNSSRGRRSARRTLSSPSRPAPRPMPDPYAGNPIAVPPYSCAAFGDGGMCAIRKVFTITILAARCLMFFPQTTDCHPSRPRHVQPYHGAKT